MVRTTQREELKTKIKNKNIHLNIKIMLELRDKLSIEEMLNIKGGVSREEYCGTVKMLIRKNWKDNWNEDQRVAAAQAWNNHCL